ncbi:DUF2812 domain-containing protein [Aquibacillus saliphilus]|uniref:DUF2812 domain-containing protein n=1 Tax=Aquibacillus saliphilus TaxID=1909422 RepID=UPI001CF0B192
MGNKLKRKVMWLDLWDIEEQADWFSHMELSGWKLIDIGKWIATFEQTEPQKVKYRCDVFKIPYTYEDERIEIYRQSDWKHVASRGYIQVFRQLNREYSNELHTDPFEQAETLKLLKKDLTTRAVLALLLSTIIIVLAMLMLQISPVRNYLEDDFLSPFIIIISHVFISYTMVTGMIHMSKLMKQLESGTLLKHGANHNKKRNRNKWLGMSLIIFLSAFLVFNILKTINLSDNSYQDIPNYQLPVVEISDILGETNYKEIPDNDEFRGSIDNYYAENSSILVPKQYELQQKVEVPGVLWEDDSGTYQPSIRSYGYQVRSVWLAKHFLQNLKQENTYFNENYQLVDSPFDELWIKEEDTMIGLIARNNNIVYHISYYGMNSTKDIIAVTEAKAFSLN